MLQRQRSRKMRMRRARVALEQRRVAFEQQWMALELQRQAAIRLVHKSRTHGVCFLHWLIIIGI